MSRRVIVGAAVDDGADRVGQLPAADVFQRTGQKLSEVAEAVTEAHLVVVQI